MGVPASGTRLSDSHDHWRVWCGGSRRDRSWRAFRRRSRTPQAQRQRADGAPHAQALPPVRSQVPFSRGSRFSDSVVSDSVSHVSVVTTVLSGVSALDH